MDNFNEVQYEIDFLESSISRANSYIHKWHREHIARLLRLYIEDVKFKSKLVSMLQEKEVDKDLIALLKQQLEDERQKAKDSAATMAEENRKWLEQLAKLTSENERLRKVMNMMIRYILIEKRAFFGYLHEHGLVITWDEYETVLQQMSVEYLIEHVASLGLLEE